MRKIIALILVIFTYQAYTKTVNVYAWGGEIPMQVIHQFEQQSGIKVNFSTYDSNETMYAKLRTNTQSMYDIVLPSTYFVERMQNILLPLDLNRLPNLKHVDSFFMQSAGGKTYGIPLVWGATGIFYNKEQIASPPKSWKELWNKSHKNQLLLLNDPREIFAMALMRNGHQPQDTNIVHIKEAYQAIVDLIPHIKLFSSEGVAALMIDGDANLGIAWNGDVFKANNENAAINFIYPKDGFVIWIDCLAIPKNAPHIEEAYAFINFLLQPEIAAQISLVEGYATTNKDGKELLPLKIRNNKTIYPDASTLQRGYIQHDIPDETMMTYQDLWQKLKLDF